MATSSKPKQKAARTTGAGDDFKTVAKRLGADEDKAAFEAKLKKIAKAKPPKR
jgi:hypothetical protein